MLYANGTSCPYVQDSTAGKLNPGHLKERNFGKLNDIKSPILSIKNDDLRYIFHLVVYLYSALTINISGIIQLFIFLYKDYRTKHLTCRQNEENKQKDSCKFKVTVYSTKQFIVQ